MSTRDFLSELQREAELDEQENLDYLQGVSVVRSLMGPYHLATEMTAFSSVLTFQQAGALQLIDPAPMLGLEPTSSGHVGLITEGGLPRGLCLGTFYAFETWTAQRILHLPGWLRPLTSEILKPGIGLDPKTGPVWILDVSTLANSSQGS